MWFSDNVVTELTISPLDPSALSKLRAWLNQPREWLKWVDKRSSYCIATKLEPTSAINCKAAYFMTFPHL